MSFSSPSGISDFPVEVSVTPLETEEGEFHRGIAEIVAYLKAQPGSAHAAEHRQRYADHHEARETDVTGKLIRAIKPAPWPTIR